MIFINAEYWNNKNIFGFLIIIKLHLLSKGRQRKRGGKGDKGFTLIDTVKGPGSMMSSDPSCKYDNAWLRAVPLKPLSDQWCGRCCRFSRFKSG